MKKRLIISIFVCVLFLTIPAASSGIVFQPTDPSRAWIFLRGWILDPVIEENTIHARAIRLRYCVRTDSGATSWGVVPFLMKVTFEKGNYMGPYGRIRFVLRFYFGYFDIEGW